MPQYDFAVIGSGPGGYVAAIRAAQLGLKTAVVEKEAKFGGTCLHWGCIPTKALLFDAEVYDYVKRAREFGVVCTQFSLDWDAILARKSKIVTKLAKGTEFLLRKNKVETVHGYGRFSGNGRISVTDAQNKRRELHAKHIVLATGSEATMLPGLEPDGATILTNKEILALKAIPKSLAIVGAGAVGLEFASIFSRLGAQVALIEMLPRIAPLEDEEISAELEKSFRKQGIAIHTGAKVEKVAKSERGVLLTVAGGDGKALKIEAQTLLVAVGRAPNTRDIGLENTRIRSERGFISVNGFMQTDEPGVYAVGDIVAASPLLAHVGHAEGIVAATHAAGKPAEPINYQQVPNCTYCEPEVSSVGLTERQARQAGHRVKVGRFPFSANSKADILGARAGFVKIVSDERYGEILGVHMIGPRVTETIAEAVLALRLEATAEDLAHTIHPHPTLSEAVLEAGHAAHDWAIHI
ncbi:MAG TPA: dihydrolipoyl dehydrogenase [Terriglobia bacterium]|nr:dihydrolipoyl dehydrogenase [Terriglobia bacterium]